VNLETIRRKFPLMKRARSTQPNAMFVIGVIRDRDDWACWGLERAAEAGQFRATEPGYFHISEADVREIFDTLMRDAEAAMQRQA
jgi:hypothetical protein